MKPVAKSFCRSGSSCELFFFNRFDFVFALGQWPDNYKFARFYFVNSIRVENGVSQLAMSLFCILNVNYRAIVLHCMDFELYEPEKENWKTLYLNCLSPKYCIEYRSCQYRLLQLSYAMFYPGILLCALIITYRVYVILVCSENRLSRPDLQRHKRKVCVAVERSN